MLSLLSFRLSVNIYAFLSLFGSNVFELAVGVDKVVGVLLDSELSVVGLLDVKVPSLLVGKVDGRLLAGELHLCGLHVVAGRLPSDQIVLPSVGNVDNVPVESPGKGSCC